MDEAIRKLASFVISGIEVCTSNASRKAYDTKSRYFPNIKREALEEDILAYLGVLQTQMSDYHYLHILLELVIFFSLIPQFPTIRYQWCHWISLPD